MKQWCRVKLKNSDLYMGDTLSHEVERKLAPIEPHDAAVHRAERRFGRNWPRFVEIIEIEDYSEVQQWRGIRGGKTVTPNRRRALKERWVLKWIVGKVKGEKVVIGARSCRHASELLGKVGMGVSICWIHRKFKRIKFCPWKWSKHPEEGVWKRDKNKEWKRLL